MVRKVLPRWGDWKQLSQQWPVVFAIAVVGWLGLSAIGLPEGVEEASSEPSTYGSAANINSALEVEVRAFHVDDGKAELTLELHNSSESNTSFRLDQLLLVSTNGVGTAADSVTPVVAVGPDVDVLAPVSFPVSGRSGGSFDLTYGSRVVASNLAG